LIRAALWVHDAMIDRLVERYGVGPTLYPIAVDGAGWTALPCLESDRIPVRVIIYVCCIYVCVCVVGPSAHVGVWYRVSGEELGRDGLFREDAGVIPGVWSTPPSGFFDVRYAVVA
jgi:hypothetical protein